MADITYDLIKDTASFNHIPILTLDKRWYLLVPEVSKGLGAVHCLREHQFFGVDECLRVDHVFLKLLIVKVLQGCCKGLCLRSQGVADG